MKVQKRLVAIKTFCQNSQLPQTQVRDVLSKYFSQLLAHVDSYGGDVIKVPVMVMSSIQLYLTRVSLLETHF